MSTSSWTSAHPAGVICTAIMHLDMQQNTTSGAASGHEISGRLKQLAQLSSASLNTCLLMGCVYLHQEAYLSLQAIGNAICNGLLALAANLGGVQKAEIQQTMINSVYTSSCLP